MITKLKLFEQTQNQKFEIPEQIREYYIIDGDMSNTKNWKSTKYFLPFNSYEKYRESSLGIRYVLISLDSNHIIPINMNDEHQIGYDVLYSVFYDKYKVPRENYVSICTWGNHYLKNEFDDQFKAIKKFLDYGGDPNLNINIRGSNVGEEDYEMPALAFIEHNGNFDEFKKKTVDNGKISPKGQELINFLSKLSELWTNYILAERDDSFIKKEYIGEQIVPLVDEFNTFIFMNDRNYKLLKDIYSKFSKKLKELIDSANVDKIGEILFTHNGIKNYIHIKLKEPKNKEVKELFWNVKKARMEFDRLSS